VKIAFLFFLYWCGAPASWAARHTTVCLDLITTCYLSNIQIIYVTQSDKKGLIVGKCICSLNNMYRKFSIRYCNSVTFIKLSINFYVSGKSFK